MKNPIARTITARGRQASGGRSRVDQALGGGEVMRGVKETRSRTEAAMLPVLSSTADATVIRAGSETTVQIWHFSAERSA